MTQQVAHILKTLRETTTIQPKQCSADTEISNAHPTVSSDVLRERHLALRHLTDMTLPYDGATDRATGQTNEKQCHQTRSTRVHRRSASHRTNTKSRYFFGKRRQNTRINLWTTEAMLGVSWTHTCYARVCHQTCSTRQNHLAINNSSHQHERAVR